MIKRTKKLEEYINTLPIIGIPPLLGGIVVAILVMISRHPSDWFPSYFYFKALGAVLGYVFISKWEPGGRVTINFDKSTFTDDERALDHLIVKYRSNLFMILPLIFYIVADFIIGRLAPHTHTGTLEGYFGSLVLGAGITIFTSGGIKYLSAWWNIRRNWKKEFGM
jgi:hypothetical protein